MQVLGKPQSFKAVETGCAFVGAFSEWCQSYLHGF